MLYTRDGQGGDAWLHSSTPNSEHTYKYKIPRLPWDLGRKNARHTVQYITYLHAKENAKNHTYIHTKENVRNHSKGKCKEPDT